MKKLLAIVLAVTMLATLSGVAVAGQFQETGNGSLSGNHYTLNIIGMQNSKDHQDMTGTSGHTIFVPLRGNAKILLVNSTDEIETCGGKDFKVLDRNAMDDGEAVFCLPEPVVDPDACPEGESEVNYTVFARALGTPGGTSWTTTCAYDELNQLWCSSITMKLFRDTGKSSFTNVTKYLLFIYADIGYGFKRYPIFDDALQGYFWNYDNKGLKHAQLRFYMTETCVPDADYVPRLAQSVECVIQPGSADINVPVTLTVSCPSCPGFWHFDAGTLDAYVPENGVSVVSVSDPGGGTSVTLTLKVKKNAAEGYYWMYVTAHNHTGAQEFETLSARIWVDHTECDPPFPDPPA
jgi:hypothetical protein